MLNQNKVIYVIIHVNIIVLMKLNIVINNVMENINIMLMHKDNNVYQIVNK